MTTLPINRSNALDPADELAALRATEPLARLSYPDGHEGWLVTNHALARAILADQRFSRRRELQHFPAHRPQFGSEKLGPAEPGFFIAMDPPDHTRYRRMLTGQFTVRRMNALEPWITEITRARLDEMERQGPPIDLIQAFALPIPSLVICELLGVPYSDRESFQTRTSKFLDLDVTPEEAREAFFGVVAYLHELVVRKRAHPADDILSGLIEGGELDDEELTGIAVLLLTAGHETTANMLGLGTFALLQHPEQLAALKDNIEVAVEELLRYLTIVHIGPVRTALEDVELDGHAIAKGECITLALGAANRDPEKFDHPDGLDVERAATGHLAFGHGIHQCLGQQLARIEMRIGFAMLFERFPTLRLAVPAGEVPMRTNMLIYGVHKLPVEW